LGGTEEEMSWVCPHQMNDKCIKLNKLCQPLQKGCVLEGKATFIDNQLDSDNKTILNSIGKGEGRNIT